MSWALQVLREEGHRVKGERRPDRERVRPPQLRQPDCAFSLDGLPAAIEFTTFWTDVTGRAAAKAGEIREAVNAQLTSDGSPLVSILSLLSYDPEALAKVRGWEQTERDAQVIAEVLLQVAHGPEVTSLHLDSAVLPSWVHASVSTSSGTQRRINVIPLPRRADPDRRADVFLAELLRKKGTQLDGWGRGIMVVGYDFHGVTADHLRDAIVRAGGTPWWRVYWMHAGPPPELIWAAARDALEESA